MTSIIRIAGTLLVGNNGDLLLQRRDNNPNISSPNMLSVFGGHVEIREDYITAAQRELLEETGLDLKPENLSLIASIKNTYPSGTVIEGAFYLATNINASELTVTEGKLEIIAKSAIKSKLIEMVPTTLFAVANYLQNNRPNNL